MMGVIFLCHWSSFSNTDITQESQNFLAVLVKTDTEIKHNFTQKYCEIYICSPATLN